MIFSVLRCYAILTGVSTAHRYLASPLPSSKPPTPDHLHSRLTLYYRLNKVAGFSSLVRFFQFWLSFSISQSSHPWSYQNGTHMSYCPAEPWLENGIGEFTMRCRVQCLMWFIRCSMWETWISNLSCMAFRANGKAYYSGGQYNGFIVGCCWA